MHTYNRAKTLNSVTPGTLLPTRDDSYLVAMARQARQARLAASRMNYRMRLAAMTAADTRKGKTW